MKNVKLNNNGVFFIVSLILFSIHCSKESNPASDGLEPEVPYVSISTPKTTFIGDPLVFYAVFRSGVRDSNISWSHKGKIEFKASSDTGRTLRSRDTLKISWNDLGAFNLTNARDTIFIQMRDNNEQSNKIIVTLENHKPVLDSIRMNGVKIFKPGQKTVRMHLNPQVEGEIIGSMHDLDGETPRFRIEGLDPLYNSEPDGNRWVFPRFPYDTSFTGYFSVYDGQGGTTRYPLEIIIYSEAHTLWVASTYGPDTSVVSKLSPAGDLLFSLYRFQQVKFLRVYPPNTPGSEALWVVDRVKRSYPASKPFTDSVYILDDDGRVRDSVGGFSSHISGFALNLQNNTAYVIDGRTIKKIDQDGNMTTRLTLTKGDIEAIDVHPINEDEYWIGVADTLFGLNFHWVIHMLGNTVVDTVDYDSLALVNGLAASFRNNIYWVAGDAEVLLVDMRTDTVISRISGFHKPSVIANQLTATPVCWVADEGNSRLFRIKRFNGTTPIPASLTIQSAVTQGFAVEADPVFKQPRAMALDYQATPPVLWVADFDQYSVIKLLDASGAVSKIINLTDLELENPEAITVNTGVY